jgi:hypothetical protein
VSDVVTDTWPDGCTCTWFVLADEHGEAESARVEICLREACPAWPHPLRWRRPPSER